MATIENYQTRDAWLAARIGIGGSDAPVVLGVSPYATPYQLWARMTGRIPPQEESAPMRWGTALEPVIAAEVERETGWRLHGQDLCIYRSEDTPWLFCSPDRIIAPIDDRGPGCLQIKTAGMHAREQWDEGPPLHYQVQVQHELAATGFSWGCLAVLIGGSDFRMFPVEFNPRFVAAMLRREGEFWERVQRDEPPEVDGSELTARVLGQLYPVGSGASVDLPHEAEAWDRRLRRAKEEIAEAELIKTECENHLKAAMGEATYGVLPDGGRYAWATRTREDKPREARITTYREFRRLK